MPKKSKNTKTAILIGLVAVLVIVVAYAANFGGGSLFQGALRNVTTTRTTDLTSTESGVSRTATVEEDDSVREAEQIEQSYDLSAGSTETIDVREAEQVDSSLSLNNDTMTATTTDSYSTTFNAGTESQDNVRAVAPTCPDQPAMIYNSQGSDSFTSLLNDIQNNTECSYQFVLNSANWNELIECEAGNTSVYNGLITCNKFAHNGELHILVRVEDGQARSSYRLDLGGAYRTHQTPDFAVWKKAA